MIDKTTIQSLTRIPPGLGPLGASWKGPGGSQESPRAALEASWRRLGGLGAS